MHRLIIDYDRCTDCWQCEQLLPGFRSKYNGELYVSPFNLDNEETAAAIEYVQLQCHEKAIRLEKT